MAKDWFKTATAPVPSTDGEKGVEEKSLPDTSKPLVEVGSDTIISIISDTDNTLQLLERRVRELRASIGM